MRHFKCLDHLKQLSPDDPAFPIVEGLVKTCIVPYDLPGQPYRAEDEGWIVLIEEQDAHGPLTDIWEDWGLVDLPWEGIMKVGAFFQAIFLANNEFGIVFVIPDAPWVNGKLRKVIEKYLDP
jgi:hypothetical protein